MLQGGDSTPHLEALLSELYREGNQPWKLFKGFPDNRNPILVVVPPGIIDLLYAPLPNSYCPQLPKLVRVYSKRIIDILPGSAESLHIVLYTVTF